MNKELLDKLKFQAAAQVSPLLEGSEWQQVYSEKFAESMVKECASLAYDGPGGILDHFGLEEHFGVEE